MKCVIVLLALGALASAQESANKTPLIERVNVDAVLKNERVFVSYVKCVLDEGPCTPEGRDLKKSMNRFQKEQNICPNCSEKEKQILHKVLLKLRDSHMSYFDKIMAKYADTKQLSDLVVNFIKNGP